MTEIEKLYMNANIDKQSRLICTYNYGVTCPEDHGDCEDCAYGKETEPEFPDFNAEKQLELLQFAWFKYGRLDYTGNNMIFYSFDTKGGFTKYVKQSTFAESIAELINILWQGLSKTEKQFVIDVLRKNPYDN